MKQFLLIFFSVLLQSGQLFGQPGEIGEPPYPETRVYYVNAINAINGNGKSWSTAFNNLQDALDVAVSGDEI